MGNSIGGIEMEELLIQFHRFCWGALWRKLFGSSSQLGQFGSGHAALLPLA